MPSEYLRQAMGQVAGQTHALALMQFKEKFQLFRFLSLRTVKRQTNVVGSFLSIPSRQAGVNNAS